MAPTTAAAPKHAAESARKQELAAAVGRINKPRESRWVMHRVKRPAAINALGSVVEPTPGRQIYAEMVRCYRWRRRREQLMVALGHRIPEVSLGASWKEPTEDRLAAMMADLTAGGGGDNRHQQASNTVVPAPAADLSGLEQMFDRMEVPSNSKEESIRSIKTGLLACV